jgi:hypothetical protein
LEAGADCPFCPKAGKVIRYRNAANTAVKTRVEAFIMADSVALSRVQF